MSDADGAAKFLQQASLLVGCSLLVAGCIDTPAQQVERMEEFGFAQRDCFASPWFETQHPELARRLDLRSQDANAECNRTRVLMEEGNDGDGFYRRYRCRVREQEVEVSLSASRLDPDGLGSCNYAYSGSASFEGDELYTVLPWKHED